MARQAVRERSSRCILQRERRCRDRADGIRSRRRGAGSRHLPDQRRSAIARRRSPICCGCRRMSFRSPGLAVGWPAVAPKQSMRLAARRDGAPQRLSRGWPARRDRGLRPPPRGRAALSRAALLSMRSARPPPMAGPRTRRGNTPCRSVRISAPTFARGDFGLIERGFDGEGASSRCLHCFSSRRAQSRRSRSRLRSTAGAPRRATTSSIIAARVRFARRVRW